MVKVSLTLPTFVEYWLSQVVDDLTSRGLLNLQPSTSEGSESPTDPAIAFRLSTGRVVKISFPSKLGP